MCCTETITFPKHPDDPKHSNYYQAESFSFSKKSKKSEVFNEITLSLMARLCKDFGFFGAFGKTGDFCFVSDGRALDI